MYEMFDFYKEDAISFYNNIFPCQVTYPSSRVSGANDTVAYACMDYDSEQEFAIFFSRSRTEILESFR